jgi:spermidine/putrescine transport system permease protein
MEKQLIKSTVIIGILIFLLSPIITMCIYSIIEFNSNILSLSGFNEIFKDVRLHEIKQISARSLIVCLTSSSIAYIISYIIVLYTDKKFQRIFLILITLPFVVNEAIRIFSWQNFLSDNGNLNNIISFILNGNIRIFSSASDLNIKTIMIITCIPFAIFICFGLLKTIPNEYWVVSDDLKINHISKFLKVGLPLSKTAILSSILTTFFVAFALSSEVNFLGGASKVSTRGFILSLMSSSKYEAIFAFGFVILLVISISFLFFQAYIKYQNGKHI